MLLRACGLLRACRHQLPALLLIAVIAGLASYAIAGHQILRSNAVGGIAINPDGFVRNADAESKNLLLTEMRKNLGKVPVELNRPVPLRMVSLRGLEEACRHALDNNLGVLPDDVKYMAGLQRIEFVFVYPEQNDIVLAGPGEGWRIDDNANVIGITTGRPVLQLDDFLIALRQVDAARQQGISCSIDPTEEGVQQLQKVLDKARRNRSLNRPVLEAQMKEAFGPQQVTITGVPADSHFARVLVAADYRMKRLAMQLDESPVRGLPSYLQMIRGGSTREIASQNPRWWLACNYQPVARTQDGLAWQLRGPGVKALTEDEVVDENGQAQGTGKTSPTAAKWAELMTEKYDELSTRDPVFGELRNLMDMCVVAAIIEKHGLLARAGCSLPLLSDRGSNLMPDSWNAPRQIAPQCSFIKARNGWIVTASGGVQIESWDVVQRTEVRGEVGVSYQRAEDGRTKSWWWN